ncbi:hypothetical protein A5904_04760 [Acidithiobacillus caldus]|uniref:hypothetical protein n=1 Tax=Acidithiobacillus caldus TaxID=33059 RepID=UPI0007D8EE7D|nr:hypothetical protein [Acidithiobacillus caldus]AUW32373.1 hypothetical protein A5904_04760 [Acidithiobacillus caldus]QER45861.1 hypothetical protein F0726_02813 [Acidithiobacillus caldus]
MELNDLESMSSSGVGTGNTDVEKGEAPSPSAPVSSGYDVIADLLPHEELKALNKWSQTYHLGGNDPLFGGYIMAKTTFSAAIAAGQAASLIHEDVNKIPDLIHHAVIAGGADITGQVHSAVIQNAETLAKAIQAGIVKSTAPAVGAVQNALKDFDSKVDKTIIARKDAVIAQWVQSGSDALDRRVREAIRTERTLNIAFMMFAILSALILGIFLGMHLHL